MASDALPRSPRLSHAELPRQINEQLQQELQRLREENNLRQQQESNRTVNNNHNNNGKESATTTTTTTTTTASSSPSSSSSSAPASSTTTTSSSPSSASLPRPMSKVQIRPLDLSDLKNLTTSFSRTPRNKTPETEPKSDRQLLVEHEATIARQCREIATLKAELKTRDKEYDSLSIDHTEKTIALVRLSEEDAVRRERLRQLEEQLEFELLEKGKAKSVLLPSRNSPSKPKGFLANALWGAKSGGTKVAYSALDQNTEQPPAKSPRKSSDQMPKSPRVNSEIQLQQEDITELKQQMKALQVSLVDKHTQVSELQQKLSEVSEQIATHQVKNSQIESKEKRIENLEKENKKLLEQLQAAHSAQNGSSGQPEPKHVQPDNSPVDEDASQVEDASNQANKPVEDVDTTTLRQENKKLKEDVNRLTEELLKAVKDLETSRQQVEQQRSENESLQTKITDLTNQLSQLRPGAE